MLEIEHIDTTGKMRKNDRIFVLEPMEGKVPLSSVGVPNRKVFMSPDNFHAIMDSQTCLWHVKLDKGELPHPLKQQFTSFSKLYNFTKDYLGRRNISIKEIKD
jgi:hypothetical protein